MSCDQRCSETLGGGSETVVSSSNRIRSRNGTGATELAIDSSLAKHHRFTSYVERLPSDRALARVSVGWTRKALRAISLVDEVPDDAEIRFIFD